MDFYNAMDDWEELKKKENKLRKCCKLIYF